MLFHREALTAIRECRGLSRSELARRVGISAPYQTQLEDGTRIAPSADLLARFAEALDVAPEALRIDPEPDLLVKELGRSYGLRIQAAS